MEVKIEKWLGRLFAAFMVVSFLAGVYTGQIDQAWLALAIAFAAGFGIGRASA